MLVALLFQFYFLPFPFNSVTLEKITLKSLPKTFPISVLINFSYFKVLALLLSLPHFVGIQELIPVLTLLEELQEVSLLPTLISCGSDETFKID